MYYMYRPRDVPHVYNSLKYDLSSKDFCLNLCSPPPWTKTIYSARYI